MDYKYIVTSIANFIPSNIKLQARRILPASFYRSLANNQVVIVSYPKCGRSWLRLLLCDVVRFQLNKPDLTEVETNLLWQSHPLIPHISVDHDGAEYSKADELNRDKSNFSNKKVIFLIRDPRDVIVSWFFEVTKRGALEDDVIKKTEKIESVADFIYNEIGGLKTIIEFYNIWAQNRNIPEEILIVKYEELRENTFNTLKKIIKFSGLKNVIKDHSINKAIDKNLFEKLKKRERNQDIEHAAFQTKDVNDSEAFKVRKGKIGGYTEYLSAKHIEAMNLIIKEKLDPHYGYNC
jgi:hypothetical protein